MKNKFKTLCIVVAISCVALLSVPCSANASWKDGIVAYDMGQYAKAYEEFALSVQNMDENASKSLYYLGRMFEYGQGVNPDIRKAMSLYFNSAKMGNLRSAADLGSIYYAGEKFQQNIPLAIEWFDFAASKGNPVANYNLGLIYLNGTGVAKNTAIAYGYFKNAADKGYALAQKEAGLLLYDGNGVPQDYDTALRYLVKAANQGNVEAQMQLGKLLSNTALKGAPINLVAAHKWYNIASAYGGDEVRKEAVLKRNALVLQMTAEQVLEAQRQASGWKLRVVYSDSPVDADIAELKEQEEERQKVQNEVRKVSNDAAANPKEVNESGSVGGFFDMVFGDAKKEKATVTVNDSKKGEKGKQEVVLPDL